MFSMKIKNEADLHSVMARPETGRLDKPADSASDQRIAEPKGNVNANTDRIISMPTKSAGGYIR